MSDNAALAKRHAFCALLLLDSAVMLRHAIRWDEWVMWRGRVAPEAAATAGYPAGTTVTVKALEGLYKDRVVVTARRTAYVACDAACADELRESCAVVVSQGACGAVAPGLCDRSCGRCDLGCDGNATTVATTARARTRSTVDVTCAAPSDLGANDCRRLKAARALCTAAFALVLVCAGATAANCYAHVADAPGRVRVFVDFVAALSGNLSSASALGTLYCASAIGARASNERDWSRQNHALRRSTYVVVGHVAVESLIAVLASRSVVRGYRRLPAREEDAPPSVEMAPRAEVV